jgi:cell division protein FtsW
MKAPFEHSMDRWLLAAVAVLLVAGILMIYSASAFWSADHNNDDYGLILKKHLLRVLVGLAVLLVFTRIDYHAYRRWSPHLWLAGAAFLVAVFLTPEFRNSHRAFSLPFGRFQPAEYMKLVVVISLASALSKGLELETMGFGKVRVQYGLLLAVAALVLAEPDLGTSMVIFFTGFWLLAIAGTPNVELARLAVVPVPFVGAGMLLFPYQADRLIDFIRAKVYGEPASYQVQQSLAALAHGGLFGRGYGVGSAKKLFLPEPFSDFILATLGEECGFLGICLLFLVLAFLLWRSTRIALRAPDRFGFLLASGITAMLMVTALINAGVATFLLPTTGLPFPFISYGGSSLFVIMAGMGILLNISGKTVTSYHQFTTEKGRICWPQTAG